MERELEISVGQDPEPAHLVMLAVAPEVYGRAVNEQFVPIVGAEVTAERSWGPGKARTTRVRPVLTDSEGAFELCLGDDEVVGLAVRGFGFPERRISPADVGNRWAGVEIVLQPGGTLDGEVLEGRGLKLVGIRVQAAVPSDKDASRRMLESVVFTDDEGRFRLEGLPSAHVEIGFWFPVAEGRWKECGTERLEIGSGETLKRSFQLEIPPRN